VHQCRAPRHQNCHRTPIRNSCVASAGAALLTERRADHFSGAATAPIPAPSPVDTTPSGTTKSVLGMIASREWVSVYTARPSAARLMTPVRSAPRRTPRQRSRPTCCCRVRINAVATARGDAVLSTNKYKESRSTADTRPFSTTPFVNSTRTRVSGYTGAPGWPLAGVPPISVPASASSALSRRFMMCREGGRRALTNGRDNRVAAIDFPLSKTVTPRLRFIARFDADFAFTARRCVTRGTRARASATQVLNTISIQGIDDFATCRRHAVKNLESIGDRPYAIHKLHRPIRSEVASIVDTSIPQ
jgi:hypothetical protein